MPAEVQFSNPPQLSPLCRALRAALDPDRAVFLRRGLLLVGLASFTPLTFAATFPAHFDVSMLDGSNGFAFAGIEAQDHAGASVSDAGDINGDGVDDFIFGAPGVKPHGASYVVFGGTTSGGALFDVAQLDGANGFRLDGPGLHDYGDASYYDFGESVSDAGDINGDGIADIIAAANGSDRYGGYSGAAFVVFGHTGAFPPSFEVPGPGSKDPTGFRILNPAGGEFGPVSDAGDVNGDGVDDVIIGLPFNALAPVPGAAFVVFGGQHVAETGGVLSDLHGDNGFELEGEADYAEMGSAVAGIGDINDDGFDDIVTAAPGNGSVPARTYVVFGGAAVGGAGSVDVAALDGSNGFVLDGVDPVDNVAAVAGGDVNGDGIADLLIGFPAVGANDSRAGAVYVVFGGRGVGGDGRFDLSSLDGSNGFRLIGDEADWAGASIAAGDVTGDGVADIVIAAPGANGAPTGKAYVVLGRKDIGSTGTIELSSLDGTDGGVLEDIPTGSRNMAVGTGADLNADGIEDVIVGSENASPEGEHSGETFVVYGIRVDTTAPTCTATGHPAVLWPPNHRWVHVRTKVVVDDAPAAATFALVSVTSNQPQRTRHRDDLPRDIRGWELMKPDTDGFLRAERIDGEQRVYTLTYEATDPAGNSSQCSARVTVPGNRGG